MVLRSGGTAFTKSIADAQEKKFLVFRMVTFRKNLKRIPIDLPELSHSHFRWYTR